MGFLLACAVDTLTLKTKKRKKNKTPTHTGHLRACKRAAGMLNLSSPLLLAPDSTAALEAVHALGRNVTDAFAAGAQRLETGLWVLGALSVAQLLVAGATLVAVVRAGPPALVCA